MEQKQMLAVAVVAILVIAAVGAYVVVSGDGEEEYRSTNTDCRLKILGNADENDYLDEEDVVRIKQMITDEEAYSLMADANHDDKITIEDAELVQKIIDTRAKNQGKSFDQKEKVQVHYIDVDDKVQEATYPVGNVVLANTQRALEIAIAIDVEDRIKAMTLSDLKAYWDDNEYKGCENIPDVGKRGEPDLEMIASIDADTIITGQASKCLKNVEGNKAGDKQIIRLPTWENGGMESAALTFGFFMDSEETAQKYAKWMDDLYADIEKTISKIPDSEKTSFLLVSSPAYIQIQQDGVSNAFDLTGSRNVGNELVTNPKASSAKVVEYKEAILEKDPEYIIFSYYIMTQMTTDDMQAKFDSRANEWVENLSGTNAYKNGNVISIDYGFPFCLITLVGASLLYEESFSQQYVIDTVQDYLENFTNVPDDFQIDYDHIVHKPKLA